MKTKLIALSLVTGVLAVGLPVFAHHGNAAYEANLTEIKSATVTRLVWANPHTLVLFDVKDDKGEIVHWNAEMGSPSALANVGWNKASLMPGDVITIYIHQAKTKNPVGRIQYIVLADGSKLTDSGGAGEGGYDRERGGRGGRGRGESSNKQ
jgi:Family of unknown function (DUF6152)